MNDKTREDILSLLYFVTLRLWFLVNIRDWRDQLKDKMEARAKLPVEVAEAPNAPNQPQIVDQNAPKTAGLPTEKGNCEAGGL